MNSIFVRSSSILIIDDSSHENSQSKQNRVSFNQNGESSIKSERYEYTFGAYLEVFIIDSSSLSTFFSFRMHILV